MPGMDGIEAMTQMIQQDERRGQQSPPFVALTAHATDDHRTRCLDHGMKAFLVKPIDRQALIQTVDALVSATIAAPVETPTNSTTVFSKEAKHPLNDPSDIDNHPDQWRSRLLKAAGNDPETALSLTQAFLEEVPQLCDNLSAALGRQDAKGARLATHTLKSCLKYVANPPDWQLVEHCEMLAMKGQLSEIEPLVPTVKSVAMQWVDRLKRL